jgi:hypothetical protein
LAVRRKRVGEQDRSMGGRHEDSLVAWRATAGSTNGYDGDRHSAGSSREAARPCKATVVDTGGLPRARSAWNEGTDLRSQR